MDEISKELYRGLPQGDFRPLNQGDTQDDDAEVFDDHTRQEPTPPTPPVEFIETPALPEPKIPTSLITVTQSVSPEWTTPTQILPADTNRVDLRISVTSPEGTATDGVTISSSVRGDSRGQAVLCHGQSLHLDGHTGAVWVRGVGDGPVIINVWSVIK